jgi:hypothetical protein
MSHQQSKINIEKTKDKIYIVTEIENQTMMKMPSIGIDAMYSGTPLPKVRSNQLPLSSGTLMTAVTHSVIWYKITISFGSTCCLRLQVPQSNYFPLNLPI